MKHTSNHCLRWQQSATMQCQNILYLDFSYCHDYNKRISSFKTLHTHNKHFSVKPIWYDIGTMSSNVIFDNYSNYTCAGMSIFLLEYLLATLYEINNLIFSFHIQTLENIIWNYIWDKYNPLLTPPKHILNSFVILIYILKCINLYLTTWNIAI